MALTRFHSEGPRAGTEAGLEGGSGFVGAEGPKLSLSFMLYRRKKQLTIL